MPGSTLKRPVFQAAVAIFSRTMRRRRTGFHTLGATLVGSLRCASRSAWSFDEGALALRMRCVAGLLLLCVAGVTAADETIPERSRAPLPAENYAINPGGVDMRTGQFVYERTDLTIGGRNALSLVRQNGIEFGVTGKPFGNLSHNWEIFLVRREQTSEGTADYTISVEGRSTGFRGGATDTTPVQSSPGGVELLEGLGTGSSRYWVFTAKDGTEVTFRPEGHEDCDKRTTSVADNSTSICMYAAELVRPNGVTYTFGYDDPSSAQYDTRLRSLTSNYGYALVFEYAGSDEKIQKACALNLGTHLLPSNFICPSGVPTAMYSYSSNGFIAGATNALGHTYTYESTYSGSLGPSYEVRHYLPGRSQPYLTNEYSEFEFGTAGYAVARQVLSDGRIYEYSWDIHEYGDTITQERAGGTYGLNGGPVVQVRFALLDRPGLVSQTGKTVTPGPSKIVDELGQVSTADYCIPNDPESGGGCIVVPANHWNYSDGRTLQLTYDAYHHNIIERRWTPKPGSPLADIVTGATYGSCLTPLLCSKPTQTVDGRGNATDFTYDSSHGSLTSILEPADDNGVRSLIWRKYAQKFAWIRSASGGYQQAAEPIWMLSSEHRCITTQGSFNPTTGSGSCAGGSSDEIVTAYEYGGTNEPNNLNVTGAVVSSGGDSLRTCYEYDDYGRRIGETSPRAGLGACP